MRRHLRLALPAAVAVAAIWVFLNLGRWLVVEDPLEHAHAVFVPAGDPPFRAIEAANLYRHGWAPEIWLARDGPRRRDHVFAKLGIEYPGEREFNYAALLRLGVPESAIRILDATVYDTQDEVMAASTQLARAGGQTLIITTSQYHSRRVKLLWRKLAHPDQTVILRPAWENGFRAGAWWNNSSDALTVAREVTGIANAWLGFPIRTRAN
jgi:uncharacterized SAM-binding protein YcdF (DUF218 family)